MPYERKNITALYLTERQQPYSNGRTRFEGDGVYSVVCANDKSHICIFEVIVYFVHLQDDFE